MAAVVCAIRLIFVKEVTHELGVDAQTGQVLENKAEGPNPD